MQSYLIIASEDPFESRHTERLRALATRLAAHGAAVSVYLVQNAVLGARRTCPHTPLEQLLDQRVSVLADDFSLRERGIEAGALLPQVKVASVNAVISRLADGWKTFWS
jgi:intracellular sulfur oxidation DsrE/DsrF family protein